MRATTPRTTAAARTPSLAPDPATRAAWWIAPAFFCSGFAALIYQIVWQRVLFATFGINVEAVTIVVTAFLLGLGVGSAVGGQLSVHSRWPLLRVFACLEMTLGAYGAVSIPLFHAAADATVRMPTFVGGVVTFVLVLLPTLLMGATLPLLVVYLVRRSVNVGLSVGSLYFVNTAGSALAAMLTAVALLGALGETRTVWLAALTNALVGAFVLTQHLRARGGDA